ncbi:hypothetical protein O3M35_013328 [Rhynocoris fuscipes]|uniref:HTH La-type RNA-binding domain-containing protein n=1 Tax=Rhynocoris fuscipes TaxID=488301 RepID=A0AAW1CE09_9HEMI
MPVAKTIAVMVDEQKDLAEASSYVPEGEDVEETSSTEVVSTTKTAESQAATTSSGAPTVANTANNNNTTINTKTIAVMVSEADEIAKLANYVPEDAVGAESVGSSQTHTEPAKEAQPSQSPQQQQQQSNVTSIQHDEKLSALLQSSGPGVMRISRYLPQSVIESIKPSGRNGRYTKSDFVGQPGFDYNDSTMTITSGGSSKLPSMSSSQPSSTNGDKDKTTSATSTKAKPATTTTKTKAAGLAAATATSSISRDIYDVIVEAGPVIKSLNDTALLKKLLNTMQNDVNIGKDVFLKTKMAEDAEGFVPLDILLTFNRLAALSKDVKVIADALKDSDKVVVDEARMAIRRKDPLP